MSRIANCLTTLSARIGSKYSIRTNNIARTELGFNITNEMLEEFILSVA